MKKTRKNLISEVLADSNKGLHVRDIARELLERNLEKDISEESLMAKVSNALSLDIKKYKAKSKFRRVSNNKGGYKQGWYRLKKVKKSIGQRAIEAIAGNRKVDIEIRNTTTDTTYTGKAGEYAVLSELLFNEFNASLMSVDKGIDIVASKDDNFFHIQVKTANNKGGKFFASVARSQFERFNNTNTFYIFVLRYFLNGKIRSDFIILRSLDIEKFLEMGVVRKTDSLSFNFSIEKGKILLNNNENVSFFFNKFDYIK